MQEVLADSGKFTLDFQQPFSLREWIAITEARQNEFPCNAGRRAGDALGALMELIDVSRGQAN